MTTPFHIRRSVHAIASKFAMPTAANHTFSSKYEQMRHWVSDPVLRDEAIEWAKGEGFQVELDEQGTAIGFSRPDVLEEPQPVRRKRYVS